MHIELDTALVVAALAASLMLMVDRVGRPFALLAVIAGGIQLLIAFGIIELAIGKLRLDVILPAVLVLSGGVCWTRSTTKPAISESMMLLVSGSIQLLSALRLLR